MYAGLAPPRRGWTWQRGKISLFLGEKIIEQSCAKTFLPLIHAGVVAVVVNIGRALAVDHVEDTVLTLAIDKQPCEQAVGLARRDLAANRITASELGKTIECYAKELGEKRKSEKAASAMFNAVLRGQL